MKRSTNNSFTLAELADKVGGSVDRDGSVVISGVNTIEAAGEGELSFVANKKYAQFIAGTGASALVLDLKTPGENLPTLRHKNPYLTFARIIDLLYPIARRVEPGIHPTAVVSKEATVGTSAGVGPLCSIGPGSSIGDNSQLMANVFIDENVSIGKNCLFHPGVRILRNAIIGDNVILHPGVVIGSDGFGFAENSDGPRKKIQHVGWVEIENDVEIGSNCTVDRGALGPTRIGEGTKIDNLCQIAHNVQTGKGCLIISQVGISGSTKLGDGVIVAGQAGIIGHLNIGNDAIVAAQSGVAKDIPPGTMVLGSPARDMMESKRIEAALGRLPDLLKRVRALEKKHED